MISQKSFFDIIYQIIFNIPYCLVCGNFVNIDTLEGGESMKVVIIGNSAAGINALEEFRKYDKESEVTLISKEGGVAYSRVLLPYYLRGKVDYDTFFIRDNDFYKEMNTRYIEATVTNIDDEKRVVEIDNGEVFPFDKLLIATGASAIKPPIEGLAGEGVYNMWTLEDVKNIEPLFKKGNRVLVLGSGFVSLQAAWAAICKGLDVTIYELAPRIMPRVLDDMGAKLLRERIIEHGAKLHVNTLTQRIERKEDGTMEVHAKDKGPFEVDLIIVGTGVRPNIGFLENTSVNLDRGILVDEKMETNVSGIYSAGDVAQGPTAFGEKHVIHALWPTAIEMGKIAGANMAGEERSYEGSLNMNVTQLFEITVASMGRFMDEEGNEIWEHYDGKEGSYLKVVLEDGIPVGGTIAGGSDLVAFLGVLRPFIRKKQRIEDSPEKLMETLHKKIASTPTKNILEVI